MPTPYATALLHIRNLLLAESTAGLTDDQLLTRFLAGRDEAAFAALLQRHGPMVLSVSRRVLRQEHEAEDIFQATFLLLAHKAGSIRKKAAVGSWLHGVAFRLASQARARQVIVREPVDTIDPQPTDPSTAAAWRELQSILDREVQSLPTVCRLPLVLCYLEGKSHEEAADQLGWPVGTVKTRLTRARGLLRDRLARRGLGLSVAALGTALAAASAPASVPIALLVPLVPAAVQVVAGQAIDASLPASVTQLVQGALKTMHATKLKLTLALILAAGCAVAGAGLLAQQLRAAKPQATAQAPTQPAEPRSAPAEAPRVDARGDPLPKDALVRFGSVRLRHGVNLLSVAFSPDGKTVVSGGGKPALRLWDFATGKELREINGPKHGVSSVAFTPDGQTLIAAGTEGHIHFWEVATGKELRTIAAHEGPVTAMAYSSKGDLVVTGGRDKAVRLWDVAGGKELQRFTGHENEVNAVALSPDGKLVVSTSYDGIARIWDAATGKEVRQLKSQGGTILGLTISLDGKTLVTGSDNHGHIWDLATAKPLHALNPGGKPSRGQNTIRTAVFLPDGKTLLTGGSEATVRIWDAGTGKLQREFRAHPDTILTLAVSRDGKYLASGSPEAPIHLWEIATGKQLHLPAGHHERVITVACSPDGKLVASAAWDRTVRIWEAATGKEVRQCIGDYDRADRVIFSPDGKLLLATTNTIHLPQYREEVFLWDVASGKLMRQLQGGVAAFAPDGKLLAVARRDGGGNIIVLIDPASGKEVSRLKALSSTITNIAFSGDGRTLLAAVRNQHIGFRVPGEEEKEEKDCLHVWDVATGQKRRAFGGRNLVSLLALSPDGRSVAISKRFEGTFQVLETITGQERGQLSGHAQMVFQVTFAPDGRTLASGSMDGTVRLWDLASFKEFLRLEGHRAWVQGLAYFPDGKRLVSSGIDTTALIWDVSSFPPRGQVAELQTADLDAAWADLAKDAQDAHVAIFKLAAASKQSLPFLRKRLEPASAAEAKRIDQWIAELDNEKFAVREQAMKELEKHGNEAEPAVRKAIAASPPLEQRRRMEALLERLASYNLRRMRVIELLERIGTPEARAQLQALAGNEPWLKDEVAATLRRMTGSP